MNKAVFIDRDGVINFDFDNNYVYHPEDVRLNPYIPELLVHLKSKGFLIVIISNQGGVGKGLYTMEDVERTNLRILELLAIYGIAPEEIYYCPHHPDSGKCICRKPGSLLLEKAISRFRIDVSQSCFIGDRETDMEAGIKAGLRTIKVRANQNMKGLIELFN